MLPAVTLLIGFADLWRGGMTLAPIALVAAYCILIPWAIWTRPGAEAPVTDPAGYRPSYWLATAVGAAVLALYVVTLAPTTAMWDTSEYMAAAYTLGLPHPPGNPFFVLLGRVFSLLPIAPTVAQRINLIAALTGAASASFWFLVAERILARWFAERWVQRFGAAMAAIIGAAAFTVWNQSVVNEKVYTVALLFTAFVSWLMLRWIDQPEGPAGDRKLILAAYLLGLGYSNHMAGFLAAPAIAAAVIAIRPATLLRWRLLAAGAAVLVLGMTPFATQPIRAAYFPPINEGEVTACTDGRPQVSCTLSKVTWERFLYNFNRKQFGKPPLIERQAPLAGQLGMWWLYFKWQWLRDPHATNPRLQQAFAVLFFALGLVGAWAHWQHERRTFWYFAPLMFSMTLALIFYMNFKYGFSQPHPPDAPTEVRDRDYFYIWSFSAWGVWAAMGLLWCWDETRQFIAGMNPRFASVIAGPILLLAFVPLLGNRDAAPRNRETFTREWAVDLLNSVEPYGILITGGDDDTFPLWYAQEVEGVRRDVTVAVTSLLGLDWYGRQVIRRPVYEYDAEKGPAIYRDRIWKKPEGPIVKMTLEQADLLPSYYELHGENVFQKDSLVARITAQYLTRDQILLLQMIKDTFPQRSIYISRGAGSYGNELGLQPYLLTQGFVRKLLPGAIKATADTFSLAGYGWFDFRTTDQLWRQVYGGDEALIRQRRWIDPSSSSIPFSYLLTAVALGEGYNRKGQTAEATKLYSVGREIAKAAGLEGYLTAEPPAPAPERDSQKG
ncbi:MAG: DUF2723 domain-containing protein [Gemmatimonadetes bacterium]|nr:DUF2723 domain-containing protein [Gemmatimonadota bacterium]